MTTTKKRKNVSLRVDLDFHKTIKEHLANNKISFNDYLIQLIKQDLKRENIKYE